MPSDTTKTESQKTLLKVIGFAALGVVAVGFFDLWPIYEAMSGAQSFQISFKGIMLGWLILSFSIPMALPTSVTGLSWGKPTPETKARHVRNAKIIFGACAGFAIVMMGLTYFFIHSHGYSITF